MVQGFENAKLWGRQLKVAEVVAQPVFERIVCAHQFDEQVESLFFRCFSVVVRSHLLAVAIVYSATKWTASFFGERRLFREWVVSQDLLVSAAEAYLGTGSAAGIVQIEQIYSSLLHHAIVVVSAAGSITIRAVCSRPILADPIA